MANRLDPVKIFMVEDDLDLSRMVCDYLHEQGFQLKCSDNGEMALAQLKECPPQLLILDVLLPGMDGLSLCKAVREFFAGPIIMLTALNDDIDEISALEIGADAYLTKPVRPKVLLAHIRALVRRFEAQNPLITPHIKELQCGHVHLHLPSRSVTLAGQSISLSSAEFNLLWLLAQRPGQVVTRDEIYQKLLNLEYDGLDRTIDVRISRIRKKLGDDPKDPSLLKAVRGIGYILVNHN